MIKLISGTYGSKPPKRPGDGPFELTAEEEARLVRRGVARYVSEIPTVDPTPIGFDETPDDADSIPEYSADMKVEELREIGKQCGLTFKIGMTKDEMVSALDAHFGETTEDDAPVFNAADAVVG